MSNKFYSEAYFFMYIKLNPWLIAPKETTPANHTSETGSKMAVPQDVITPIKFCLETYFSGLRSFNEAEIPDSEPPSLKSLPENLCSEFLRPWKKSINLNRVWTREPWISRRARYPDTSEADLPYELWPPSI